LVFIDFGICEGGVKMEKRGFICKMGGEVALLADLGDGRGV